MKDENQIVIRMVRQLMKIEIFWLFLRIISTESLKLEKADT